MARVKQKIIVVGGGIIGAAAAFELQSRGADVLVLDAGNACATDASFGWINASFFQTPAYFALRAEGIAAYHRLSKRVDVPLSWSGALAWEFTGAALEDQYNSLSAQGYPCQILEQGEIAALEPDLGHLPERAIRFTGEAAVESSVLTQNLRQGAVSMGARIAQGFQVTGFAQAAGRVTGVQTDVGRFEADQILVAAGTGTQAILNTLGVHVPMLHRPALVLTTRPVLAKISHVLATDFGEVRQLPDGAILMPAAIGHQADASERLDGHPDEVAGTAMSRLRSLFPNEPIALAKMQLAYRPVPQDGFPAVGYVAPGLYTATMHSGITLAAIMGELIGEEMLNGPSEATQRWLATFRADRFG